jgi:hypothetical protein
MDSCGDGPYWLADCLPSFASGPELRAGPSIFWIENGFGRLSGSACPARHCSLCTYVV